MAMKWSEILTLAVLMTNGIMSLVNVLMIAYLWQIVKSTRR